MTARTERILIIDADEAARLLGVSRVTLWKWIKKLDISVEL